MTFFEYVTASSLPPLLPLIFCQMWVKTTHVVPGRLTTDEKKEWLTEDKLKKYRKVVDSSDILSSVDGIVDGAHMVLYPPLLTHP